jgi:hypothetical protein
MYLNTEEVMIKQFIVGATLSTAILAATAEVRHIDFENIAPYPHPSTIRVNGYYYSGGSASNGQVGPDLGVWFTPNGYLLCLNTASTQCSQTSASPDEPNNHDAIWFTSRGYMVVLPGFETGMQFSYELAKSFPFGDYYVEVFDGTDGNGNSLARLVLDRTGPGSAACPDLQATTCPFVTRSISFNGVARSVVFGGPNVGQSTGAFDNIILGAVPEIDSLTSMLLGLGFLGARHSVAVRRQKFYKPLA